MAILAHSTESTTYPDVASIPLALYLHFPWCVRKCPYCDFNSHPVGSSLDEAGYVDAMVADLALELSRFPVQRPVSSIFLGGGTPSLFSPEILGELLGRIGGMLEFAADVEITMEANPGTTEHADFSAYRAAGINRLSLGVQSFNADNLRRLGRIHSGDDAARAMEQARDGGFDNVNIDLMHGLPGQTVETAMDDLERAISLEPGHLSVYQLTLEPNTVFHRYPPTLPPDDTLFAIQEALQAVLAAAGYPQYEVSAYARPGLACRHNRNYWTFGDYLGIGAGAHGKITSIDGRITRRARRKHPGGYLAVAGRDDAVAETRELDPADRLIEYLMNALRLRDGFTLAVASARTGLSPDQFSRALGPALERGLVEHNDERIRCTPRGYLFLDTILSTLEDAA